MNFRNSREVTRRLIVWGALLGVVLYIFGEIGNLEPVTMTGIWILVASIGAALVFKFLTFVIDFFTN